MSSDGRVAAELARTYGHKKCEQSLQFCKWNIEKYETVRERRPVCSSRERDTASRRAHQFADSKTRLWLSGPRGTEYMLHTPNPVPLSQCKAMPCRDPASNRVSTQTQPSKFDYGWFDPLRAQQLVPSTHHVLTYSDPSSTALQPRSLLNPQGYKTSPSLRRKKN